MWTHPYPIPSGSQLITRRYVLKSNSEFYPWKCPMDPITGRQRIIGVYNHLLSKVFRFHYHHQKVIGSLGMFGIWFCFGGGQIGEVMLRKRRSDGKRGNCQWWIPFLEILRFSGKLRVVYQKNNLGDTPIPHRSMIAGGRVANTTCLLFFGLSINSRCFQGQGWENQCTVFTLILGPTKQIGGHWFQAKGTTQWIKWTKCNDHLVGGFNPFEKY